MELTPWWVVTTLKYNKSTIDNAIYINVLYGGTMYYTTVSNGDVIKTANNETSFTEPRRFFEEDFEMKVQEVSVPKYLNFRICQFNIGFIIYQTDKTMELVN